MHSLFREDVDAPSRKTAQGKRGRPASYIEFLADDLARAGPTNSAATVSAARRRFPSHAAGYAHRKATATPR
jgi:hypothetical protein